MKHKIYLSLLLIVSTFMMAHSQHKINITIDGKTLTATLADTKAAMSLLEKLTDGPVTITMSNYGGFEKVGTLPWSLPATDSRITTKPGDIMLYNGNNIVIFYGQNTWAYTPLGILETTNASEVSNFVGKGDKEVTLSGYDSADVADIIIDTYTKCRVLTLDGKEVFNRPLSPGFYIVNNKKIFIK